MKYSICILLACLALLLSSCQSAKLESFVNPGYDARSLTKVAILPISNTRLSAGQASEVVSSFTKAVQARNSKLELVSASEAIEALNNANKADLWSDFLRNYSAGGIPNTNTLKEVAGLLGVDGIIQGTIIEIKQEDSNGFSYPMTRVVLRYTMFSGRDGSVLWEITGDGSIQPYAYRAVPVFEALKLANDKVLQNLPL